MSWNPSRTNVDLEFILNSVETCFMAVRKILGNLPHDWLELTTHRLDIYDEAQAKSQFLEQLGALQLKADYSVTTLKALPTAYDYIRLGHQLSCILEWVIAEVNQLPAEQVITFVSKTMPILAILRKNALDGKETYLYYDNDSSPLIDLPRLEQIYGYRVQSQHITDVSQIPDHAEDTVIYVTEAPYKTPITVTKNIDATVNLHPHYGSAILIHNPQIENIVKDVQHVRRRECVAMTPVNALNLLHEMINDKTNPVEECPQTNLDKVYECIKENTGSPVTPLIASSGLSIQYAMLMGLIEDAITQHPNKPIHLIIPPNCYGGTNDQARRIADLISSVEIVDLHVDGGRELVGSLDTLLREAATNDCVPIILAEIPTNPRVEVPDMDNLAAVLTTERKTQQNTPAVKPVFTVDQTFCPNVKLLHQASEIKDVKTVSYSSGSKFPSGGRCIAGFCATNKAAQSVAGINRKAPRFI